jgi:hypothetical protein
VGEEKREHKAVFRESQGLNRFWVWALAFISAAGLWFLGFSLLLDRESGRGGSSADWMGALLCFSAGLAVPLLLLSTVLVVEVREDGLYYRYRPFHRRFHRIPLQSIRRVEARTYRPLLEYGGWGIRCGWKGGKAYTVSGKEGVQLELDDGKRILFGSRDPEGLARALREAMEE